MYLHCSLLQIRANIIVRSQAYAILGQNNTFWHRHIWLFVLDEVGCTIFAIV